MKKVFLTVLTLVFIVSVMVSCQSEKKKESKDTAAVTGSDTTKIADSLAALPVIEPTKEEIAKAEVKAPDFSSSELNEELNEFNSLKEDYISALANKDKTAIKSVLDRYNTWVTKTASYVNKLPSAESQKFIDYYEKLNQQWTIVERQAKKK